MNKSSRASYDLVSLCYVGVSLFGLGILAILTFNIPASLMILPVQKKLTGTIFIIICFLGMMVGVSPARCSRILHPRGRNRNLGKADQVTSRMLAAEFSGHHPKCGNFSTHVLQIRGKEYCAGCTGLVTGAMISLFGSLLYFFLGLSVGEAGMFIFWFGFVGVLCGLVQHHLFNGNRGIVHFFLNVVFVLGAFLLLVGVNEITVSLVHVAYLFALIGYWVTTRMILSQLEHKRVCVACGLKWCNSL